jgi:hypothetical protein
MALKYTDIATQAATESFILRVQSALLQDVNNGTTRMLGSPPLVTDVTLPALVDRLARQIVADPHAWAIRFARLIAVQLIGKATLLDEAITTDGDIAAAEAAVFNRFLASF